MARPTSVIRRLRSDDGVSSLELAFIAPSLIAIIFFVIQASLWFYGRSVALSTAREGVSQLRLAQTTDAYNAALPGVQDDVTNYARNVGSGALNGAKMQPTYDHGAGTVTVKVTGTTISLVPFLTLTVTQTATGRIEFFGNGQ